MKPVFWAHFSETNAPLYQILGEANAEAPGKNFA
jgi:hypothetical protein